MSLLLNLGFISIIIYLVSKYYFSYWKKRNVFQVEPTFLVGNVGKLFMLKAHMGDIFGEIYNKYKHKRFVGGYLSYKPILIVTDPELLQDVLIRDFTSFHDRLLPGDIVETYPFTRNLLALSGQKWRDLRAKLTPTLSSGKIKAMFPIMRDCGKVLTDYLEKNIKNGNKVFDFTDLMARLTINNISSVAFGVENDCINEPDNVFRKMGLKIFEPSFRNGIINTMAFFTPTLFTKLKINPFLPEIGDFVYSLVNQTIEYREKNNIQRKDFMQLLIELKDKGFVSADKKDDDEIEWKSESNGNGQIQKLTIDELAAQAFVFFGAGFETSSSTMSFCLFELSRNKDVQKKVQEEIVRVMKTAEPEGITYDLLNEMKYLDCCVDETLRKYPIFPVLYRVATKDYEIPGSNAAIEKDTLVFIPLMGMQRDPQIFEDPLKFKPERFLNSPNGDPKVKTGIVYAPFGDGPR